LVKKETPIVLDDYDPIADIEKQIQAAKAQEQSSYLLEQKLEQIEQVRI
jgi:hypothetical protein